MSEVKKLLEDVCRSTVGMKLMRVVSVDEVKQLCTASDLDNEDLVYTVFLSMGVGSALVQFPKVGSFVLVARNIDRFVAVSFSEVEKVVLLDGQDEVVYSSRLVEQLNRDREILIGLLDIILGPPIQEPGNGVASAFQLALSLRLAGSVPGVYTDVSNPNFKH